MIGYAFGIVAAIAVLMIILFATKAIGFENPPKKEHFEQYGQPNYGLAIGIPVTIVTILVVFKIYSTIGKK